MIPRKVIASAASLAFAASLAGCMSSNSPAQPDVQLAAYAASTTYPNSQPEMAKDVGVLLAPSSKAIRVLNFSQAGINNSEIWLNGTYVYKVDTIAGDGSVRLPLSEFYDHNGHSFADQQATPTKIELRSGDHLWTLLGPIVE
jgi:hypothetical protein